MNSKIKIQTVIEVYFRAMLAGYFSDQKSDNVTTTKVGNKTTLTYYEGTDWVVVDGYTDNYGTTEIFWKGNSVWIMFYWGYYPKEVIPTLMKAISINLSKKEFLGGRGPEFFQDGNYTYENFIHSNDPMDFSGEEKVYTLPSTKNPMALMPHGQHRYVGRAVSDLLEV